MGVGGQCYAPTALPPGKDQLSIVQEAGWTPGTVWMVAKNLARTRIQSPDRSARRVSLYRLSYPGNFGSFQSCISYQNAHSLHVSPEYPGCLNCSRGNDTVVIIKGRKCYFALFTPWKCRRSCRGTAPLNLNIVSRWRWFVNLTLRPPWPWERIPVPIEEKLGLPEPVLTLRGRQNVLFMPEFELRMVQSVAWSLYPLCYFCFLQLLWLLWSHSADC
jgi:hypothetical protein